MRTQKTISETVEGSTAIASRDEAPRVERREIKHVHVKLDFYLGIGPQWVKLEEPCKLGPKKQHADVVTKALSGGRYFYSAAHSVLI